MKYTLQSLMDKRRELLDQIDDLVDSGGQLLRTDPLMVKYQAVNQKIDALKKKG
jgi:hypothetical protein